MKKKIEKAESSASEGALFKEEIPQKKVFGDLWMNKHELPPQKGRQLEAAAEGDSLMGRLAMRMASRDMIDELDLGPKGRSPEAKKAQVADLGVPHKIRIAGPSEPLKKGTKIEMEHTKDKGLAQKIASDHLKEHKKYYDSKIGLPAMEKKLNETAEAGMGLHQQTSDLKAFNSSDPIPTNKVREGNNMAAQARNAGNVFDTMHDRDIEQQKSLKK